MKKLSNGLRKMDMSGINLKKLNECIENSQNYLFSRQSDEGFWVGMLEADVSVVAGFIILFRFLGIQDAGKDSKAYCYLRKNQNIDGSWSLYTKGEGNLDVTIQSYFCLKMMGVAAKKDFMEKARNFILLKGGIENANTYTKIILALYGQYPWKALPVIPPEIIYLPEWFCINIYDFASWTRATVMAFSIILTLKPVIHLEKEQNILEIYRDSARAVKGRGPKIKNPFSIEAFFIMLVEVFKLWEKIPLKEKPGRQASIKMVEKWIIEHQEEDGSWGGIMLPWLFSLIALKCLGYSIEHPVMKKGIEGLDGFIIEDSEKIILQPATSPVWDTAWTVIALIESGVKSNNAALRNSADWLLEKKIKAYGDWKIKNKNAESGCWSFEFYNKFYPDVDDTAIVCKALDNIDCNNNHFKNKSIKEGLQWVLNMQNKDGSWAAFDRNNNKKLLRHIPYSDFITPLDFGSPDITAHVLNVLGYLNYPADEKALKNALGYLMKTQEEDGSWFGRWGVNYIYGTSKVLQAVEELKESRFHQFDNPLPKNMIHKALDWLKKIQNKDGGWSESCESYECKRYTRLDQSNPSQTAWALEGLLSLHKMAPFLDKGIDFLLNTQRGNGSWTEDFFTGGGFPNAFYLKYEMYKDYFPLIALSKYRKLINKN
ncbi:MAG: squalene--hopene cyclase [Actinobacteria bacterium]|nr:squalene--hopene cyclase [Actinomycetota bacterium]